LGGVGFVSVFVTFFFLLDFFFYFCVIGEETKGCDKGSGNRAQSRVDEAVDQKRLKAKNWNNKKTSTVFNMGNYRLFAEYMFNVLIGLLF